MLSLSKPDLLKTMNHAMTFTLYPTFATREATIKTAPDATVAAQNAIPASKP